MDANEDRDNELDRFLREGVREFVPAVRALNAFIHEVEIRLRGCLKVHDAELAKLGIALDQGKLRIAPKLGQGQTQLLLRVGIGCSDQWSFFIQLDPDELPERSMYVAFWLWTPVSKDRQGLFRLLHPIWNKDDFTAEMAKKGDAETIYVGRYANQEDQFPAFQTILDGVIRHVIAGLKQINFVERFGSGFQKRPTRAPSSEPE